MTRLLTHCSPSRPAADYLLPVGTTLKEASTSPLESLPFTSRIDPTSPHDLASESTAHIDGETARCYHFPSPGPAANDVFVDYGGTRTGDGVRVRSEGGWEDSVLWNPGPAAGNAIGDLHEGGWQDFVCWEPGVIQNLRWLGPGEVWQGRQLMTAV